jgi:hypothetical protein
VYFRLSVSILFLAALAAAADKKYKDGEYEIYSEAAKDINANNFAKALQDLDVWKQQFPDSDYRDDRQFLYVQAYAGAKQPAKVLDAAGDLLSKDIDAALGNPGSVVTVLFKSVVAAQEGKQLTSDELAAGEKAARQLLAYDKKPEGLTAEAWTQARGQLQTAAKAALIHAALTPGVQAMDKHDCAAAETIFTRALGDYPDSAQAAWQLGTAELCLYKTQPEKASPAIYAIARADVVDPGKGTVDPNFQKSTVEPYLEKIYKQYHGDDPEGLKQLKELAATSPTPPAGFKIKSASEIAHEREMEFEKSNPQLALWMKIKAALADTNGEQYFNSSLKDASVPQLKGVLVEAKPACRPKELLVAVPLPGSQQAPVAEISLKLDEPLKGKPEPKSEFQWQGVPSAFTSNPNFLLTMDTDVAKIEGLQTTPCAAAPARSRAPARKKQ